MINGLLTQDIELVYSGAVKYIKCITPPRS
jgi:hypothetical protein